MFNKSYYARARRGGVVSAGAILEELVERAADRRRKKRGNLQEGLQLELFADQPVPRDSDRPLLDLTHCVPSNSQYLSLAIEKGLVGDTLSGLQPAHVAAVLSTDVETTPANPAIKEMGLMA